ncbi:MAG: hypothetical protein ACFFEU_09405 [Candidatus Thorarchaeota archaeon]
MIDYVLARPLVTRGSDGDIWLGSGGTQKFLAVEIHSLQDSVQIGCRFHLLFDINR